MFLTSCVQCNCVCNYFKWATKIYSVWKVWCMQSVTLLFMLKIYLKTKQKKMNLYIIWITWTIAAVCVFCKYPFRPFCNWNDWKTINNCSLLLVLHLFLSLHHFGCSKHTMHMKIPNDTECNSIRLRAIFYNWACCYIIVPYLVQNLIYKMI